MRLCLLLLVLSLVSCVTTTKVSRRHQQLAEEHGFSDARLVAYLVRNGVERQELADLAAVIKSFDDDRERLSLFGWLFDREKPVAEEGKAELLICAKAQVAQFVTGGAALCMAARSLRPRLVTIFGVGSQVQLIGGATLVFYHDFGNVRQTYYGAQVMAISPIGVEGILAFSPDFGRLILAGLPVGAGLGASAVRVEVSGP